MMKLGDTLTEALELFRELVDLLREIRDEIREHRGPTPRT